jgi:hypothetical protein
MLNYSTHKVLYKFVFLFVIYAAGYTIVMLTALNQDNTTVISARDLVKPENVKPSDLANDVIDQLKENRAGYSNNVWTTLATLVAAIGMVLGSNKFQSMLRSDRLSAPIIQIFLFALYGAHAFAYMLYQKGNMRLMEQLGEAVGSVAFYKTYRILDVELLFNLFFDTVMFLLLAYVVFRVRDIIAEKT